MINDQLTTTFSPDSKARKKHIQVNLSANTEYTSNGKLTLHSKMVKLNWPGQVCVPVEPSLECLPCCSLVVQWLRELSRPRPAGTHTTVPRTSHVFHNVCRNIAIDIANHNHICCTIVSSTTSMLVQTSKRTFPLCWWKRYSHFAFYQTKTTSINDGGTLTAVEALLFKYLR